MAVYIGSARQDERAKLSGGQAGDQTGNEVATQTWYLHKKGWVVIRAKDAAAREKIAKSMEMICANNHIGYDQGQRNTLYNAVKSLGYNASRVTANVECDCSAAVRVCCAYAGIIVGDFNTASEVNTLRNSGKFDIITDTKYTNSSDYLLRGDILVTKTKGHTVVVLGNGAKAVVASNKPSVATYTVRKGAKTANAKVLQQDLNYLGYTDNNGAKLAEDGNFGAKSEAALIKFQKANGLTADGIYGKNSWTKMKSLI